MLDTILAPLVDIIPARYRKYAYLVIAILLLIVVFGPSVGIPIAPQIKAIVSVLGSAFGITAAANVKVK